MNRIFLQDYFRYIKNSWGILLSFLGIFFVAVMKVEVGDNQSINYQARGQSESINGNIGEFWRYTSKDALFRSC